MYLKKKKKEIKKFQFIQCDFEVKVYLKKKKKERKKQERERKKDIPI